MKNYDYSGVFAWIYLLCTTFMDFTLAVVLKEGKFFSAILLLLMIGNIVFLLNYDEWKRKGLRIWLSVTLLPQLFFFLGIICG